MFFCRPILGVRSLISIPAGIARMKILPFLAYTAAGTGIWAVLLAYLGYFLGTEYTGLFLSGIVCRVNVSDSPWPHSVYLDHHFFFRPSKMRNLRLDDHDTAYR